MNSCLLTCIIYDGHKITITTKRFYRRVTVDICMHQLQSFRPLFSFILHKANSFLIVIQVILTKIKASILHICQSILGLQNPHSTHSCVRVYDAIRLLFNSFRWPKKHHDLNTQRESVHCSNSLFLNNNHCFFIKFLLIIFK